MSDLSADERAALNRLVDEAAIRAVITNYTYAADWRNAALFKSLFWPEAQVAVGPFNGSGAEFGDYVETLEAGYQRRLHMFSGERIALFGDLAEAEVGCVIVLRAALPEGGHQDEFMWGRYLFELARREGVWKVSRLSTIANLREKLPPAPAKPARAEPSLHDRLGPGHPLYPRFG